MIGLLLACAGRGVSRDSVPSTDWLKTLPQQAVSVDAAGAELTTECVSVGTGGCTSGAAENHDGGAESLPTSPARAQATETRGGDAAGVSDAKRAPDGNGETGAALSWAARRRLVT